MMEAASTSVTSVNFYQTAWCNNPADSLLHIHHHENLKSYIYCYVLQVSEGSTVEGNFKFNLSHKIWPNKKALQRFVKREYPVLASYTEVKGANHMELKVGSVLSLIQNSGRGIECNIDSLTESRVLTAYSTVQIKTEGCFHEDYIGDNQV
jgi:hypothetical protein